jgi:uncharacterized protein (TIGR03437 family)
VLTLLCSAVLAIAQNLQVAAVVNGASGVDSRLPGSTVAPGSVAVIWGSGFGTGTLQKAENIPLPRRLSATSFEFLINDTWVASPILFVAETQAAVIVPSAISPGSALVRAVQNGQQSNSFRLSVSRSAPGIFTREQNGTGAAIVFAANGESAADSSNPLRPGQLATLWTTGLGAAINDDEPEARSIGRPVRLLVGDQLAEVTYQGRSGCCVGIDQINFRVPVGIVGCHVPVSIQLDEQVSNFALVPIANVGQSCTKVNHPQGMVTLERTTSEGNITESATAEFTRSNPAVFSAAWDIPVGSCFVRRFSGLPSLTLAELTDNEFLSVGALQLEHASYGKRSFQHSDGVYQAQLNDPIPFLQGGRYQLSWSGNGSVAETKVDLDLPAPLVWPEWAATTEIDRHRGLTVRWNASIGSVAGISGSVWFPDGEDSYGAEFHCRASSEKGTFQIPSAVLLSLPTTQDPLSQASLFLSSTSQLERAVNGFPKLVVRSSHQQFKGIEVR